MTDNFKNNIVKESKELGFSLSEDQINKLYVYYSMVVEKNKVMNLTAITDENDFLVKHIIDSMAVIKAGDKIKNILYDSKKRIIDVGTGAGMPGIIIKICFPDSNIVLFDSLKKRLNFLDEVISELSLKNIYTLHGRAEDIGRDNKYRESFDLVVSRAVANMSTLSEYLIPFVKVGGKVLAMKGDKAEEELEEAKKAIKLLGGKVENIDTSPHTLINWIGKDETIPRTDFDKYINELNFILFLYPTNSYKLTASGAITDAIRLHIPILSLKNDFFCDLIGNNSIGYLKDTIEELANTIRTIITTKESIDYNENFSKLINKTSIPNIAKLLNTSLQEKHFI